MDSLEYATLPLEQEAREELKKLDEKRIHRFRAKVAQDPSQIQEYDQKELLEGRLRDFLSLIPTRAPQREQWLRGHADRVLQDKDVQDIVFAEAKRHLSREDDLTFRIARKLRKLDDLCKELLKQAPKSASEAVSTTVRKWAACPLHCNSKSSGVVIEPKLFDSREEAESFLRKAGSAWSWIPSPVVPMAEVSVGTICNDSLLNFLKPDDIDPSVVDDLNRMLDRCDPHFGHPLAEIPCLGSDWDYPAIETKAAGSYWHRFDGVRVQSVRELLWRCLAELESAVHKRHPRLTLEAARVLWKSRQVQYHLESVSAEYQDYGVKRRLHPNIQHAVLDAQLFVQAKLGSFSDTLDVTAAQHAAAEAVASVEPGLENEDSEGSNDLLHPEPDQKSRKPTDEQMATAEAIVEKHSEVVVRHAAWYLGCSPQHIRRLIQKRKLTATKTRPKRIKSASLQKYKWQESVSPKPDADPTQR